MSLERLLKILESSGFAAVETEVYVYLAKRSPQTAKEITQGLRIPKKKLSPILNSLQEKGVVSSCCKPVTQFSAVSIEKVIDIQVKKTMNQVKSIKEAKKELLFSWRNMETQT